MKNTPQKDLSQYRQTASRLRALLGSGIMPEGSLCKARTGGRERWQLTRKVRGKTQTLYVPENDAAALKEATQRHREAARLFRALGQMAWRIVQEGVRSRPAPSIGKSDAAPGRHRTGAKRSGG
jgi:hypothetical protein